MWIVYTLSFLILVLLVGQLNRKAYTLPKTIWTHWDSDPVPIAVQKTVDRMKRMCPGWEVNFIRTEDYLDKINQEEIPPGFQTLRVEHQADWIRLKLLKTYGGCWIDSGIILNQSIDSLWRDCVSNRADLLCFKILGTQSNPAYPIAENWFLMAPPNSPLVSAWLEEYEKAIRMGFKRYKDKLKEDGVDLQKLMEKPEDVYLTQHGCYQKVIQQKLSDSKVVYHVAEDTMFKIHAKVCKWDKPCIWKTLQDKTLVGSIPYVKLRGGDRKNVDILPLVS